MSSSGPSSWPPHPPQDASTAEQPASGDAARPRNPIGRRTVIGVALAALFVGCIGGVGIGGDAEEDVVDPRVEELETLLAAAEEAEEEALAALEEAEAQGGDVGDLQEEVSEREARITELESEVAALEDELSTAEAQVAMAEEEAEAAAAAPTPTTPTPAPATTAGADARPGAEGIRSAAYTAESFTFNDVQVRPDGLDDFEVVARVTNEGEAVELASFTVTIFDGGSVVATASGNVSDFGAGETNTITFITSDDYTDAFDAVEFQVDFVF